MPSKAQIKAREAFVKKYATKKKGSKSTKTRGVTKATPKWVTRVAKLKAYDIKNKHKNWLRAKEAGISKKEFEKFWKNFTKLY
jgi:ribosomal protein L11